MSEPRRRWNINIEMQADTLADAERAIGGILWRLAKAELEGEQSVSITSGGWGDSFTLGADQDPEWTHERYVAAITGEPATDTEGEG